MKYLLEEKKREREKKKKKGALLNSRCLKMSSGSKILGEYV